MLQKSNVRCNVAHDCERTHCLRADASKASKVESSEQELICCRFVFVVHVESSHEEVEDRIVLGTSRWKKELRWNIACPVVHGLVDNYVQKSEDCCIVLEIVDSGEPIKNLLLQNCRHPVLNELGGADGDAQDLQS